MDRRQLTVTTMDDGCTQRLPKLKKTRKYLGSIDEANERESWCLSSSLDGQQKQQQEARQAQTVAKRVWPSLRSRLNNYYKWSVSSFVVSSWTDLTQIRRPMVADGAFPQKDKQQARSSCRKDVSRACLPAMDRSSVVSYCTVNTCSRLSQKPFSSRSATVLYRQRHLNYDTIALATWRLCFISYLGPSVFQTHTGIQSLPCWGSTPPRHR